MSELTEETLDLILGEFASAELEGQLGRCEKAFSAHQASYTVTHSTVTAVRLEDLESPDRQPGPLPMSLIHGSDHGRPPGRAKWFLSLFGASIAGAALAASISALLMTSSAAPRHSPTANPIGGPSVVSGPRPGGPAEPRGGPLLQYTHRQLWDGGTVVIPGPSNGLVPARKVIRREIQHLQWYDPAAKGEVEMNVPRQDEEYLEMDTY